MSDHHDKLSPGGSPAAVPLAEPAPMFSRAAWARILPFLIYLFFIVAVDMLGRMGVSEQTLRWMYPVKIGAVLLMLIIGYRHYTELHTLRLSPIWTVISIAVGLLVFVLWIKLDAPWMVVGESAGFNPVTDGRIDWILVALRIAGAALVVPVMEELFWRSFLMRWIVRPDFEQLDPSQVNLKSIAITVVLFGFEHNLWFAGVVAGLAYSLLYMRQRSLWSAILAHAITNGVLGLWIVRSGSWNYW